MQTEFGQVSTSGNQGVFTVWAKGEICINRTLQASSKQHSHAVQERGCSCGQQCPRDIKCMRKQQAWGAKKLKINKFQFSLVNSTNISEDSLATKWTSFIINKSKQFNCKVISMDLHKLDRIQFLAQSIVSNVQKFSGPGLPENLQLSYTSWTFQKPKKKLAQDCV